MQPIDILKEDFSQTLAFIDKCDDHIFKIKNWAIITSSAVIAFAVSQNHDVISLANLVLLLPFIYLELMYKSFQDTAIGHTDELSERIDKYLKNPQDENLLEKYEHSYGRKLNYPSIWPVLIGVVRNKHRRHIVNFYLLLALVSVGAFIMGLCIS